MLKGEENLNEEMEKMFLIFEVYVAYTEEDYKFVIQSLGEGQSMFFTVSNRLVINMHHMIVK